MPSLKSVKIAPRSFKVPGISAVVELYEKKLVQNHSARICESKAYGEILHCKVPEVVHGKSLLTVKVFDTDTILVQPSRDVPGPDFNASVKAFERLATSCVSGKVEESLRLSRVKELAEYVERMNESDDNAAYRTSIVLLCETITELLINEKLDRLRILDSSLIREGVPKKIDVLNEKEGSVYKKKGILDLYEMRNGICHRGDLIQKGDAGWAKALVKNLISNFL